MSEAFLKVVNMSISAGWLVLAVLALRLILKKAPKWVNVLLWGIVAVRLICPFSIESALSLIPSRETISPEIMMDWTPEISTGIAPLDRFVNPVISTSFAPQGMASANPLQILIPVAANLWLLGVLILLAYTAISYLTLRYKLRTAVILRDNIFQCETVSSPFVLGIVKPRIYLPYAMDGQNLHHVVAHEKAHIRRKDHWWKPLGFLLLTVYWFNPLMWVAYILLCRDIELACDEKVIAELGNEQRANYTQALVACAVNRRMIAACPLAFGEVGVKDRVKSIMNYRKPAFWVVVTALVVCLVVAVCFLTDPIDNTNDASYLNYKNSVSISMRQDVIPAVHYSSEKDQGSIGIGMVEGSAFAEYLDLAQWREKRFVPSDLSSPGSIAVNLAENLRITVYDRNFAAVKFNAEVCYYRIAKGDYDKLREMLMPPDEQRLEKSSEARPELVLGIATVDPNMDGISFGIYDLEGEYAGITEMKLRNLHNGKDTVITEAESIESILGFINKVAGVNATSSKGYYGGSYSLDIYNGSNKIFSIGFGDDESFNYGDYGDGYPTRYDLRGVTREEVIRFFSRFDSSGFDWGLSSYKFRARILEINEGYFLVEPEEGSAELNSSNKIEVPIKHIAASPDPQVGDILEIEYDGMIQELYPAKIPNVYQITLEILPSSDLKWNLNCELPSMETEIEVYKTQTRSIEECDAFAKEFEKLVGVEYTTVSHYEEAAYYMDQSGEENGTHFLYVSYLDPSYEYHCDYGDNPVWGEGSREVIEAALSKFPVFIPEYAEFTVDGLGWHSFIVDKHIDGSVMIDGILRCRYAEDGTIRDIEYNLLSYTYHDKVNIISAEDAYQKLREGKSGDVAFFKSLNSTEVTVLSCKVGYEVDPKGFYQPVYIFEVLIPETGTLYTVIPAMK